MSGMPDGWMRVQMQDLVTINPPRIQPDLEDRTPLVFVPMPKVAEDFRGIDVSGRRPFSSIKRGYTQFRPGDVLFAKITPCMENGKIAIVPEIQPPLGYGSTEFFVMRPRADRLDRWIAYSVARSSFRQLARENMQGAVGQRRVPKVWLKDASVPLAPLPEQHRIVAKIESLFAKLDEGVAALKRAEANLERYRASVLKAAVEGRLTERWRRENPPEETGEDLLRRILAERRKRWEAEQLAKFEAKGRKPPKNWRAKYKEPVTPDTSGLPRLPEGWCWATLDQVALGMRNGRSVRTRAGGFPVLRLSAITGGVLDECDFKEGDWGPQEAEPFRVRHGDFFVSRGNGSLDLVGRASFVHDCVGEVAFPDTMIRVTFACRQLVRARFVAAIWNSHFIRAQITGCAKTSAGIYKINQLDLRGVLLPVSPVAEQDMITASHGEFELMRSHLANRITVCSRHAAALRQSILKRAFEGRLVAQDPTEEPASVLMERIRAERAAERKRRKRRPSQRKRQPKSLIP